jgi:hypothetical protein
MPGQAPFPWVMASSSGWVPNSQGGYTSWSDGGTSFAGPYVAGLAALLWQQNPAASASEIIHRILAGASIGGNAATAALPPLLTGSAGADRFQAAAGMSYDGGAGLDTIEFTGNKSAYSVGATATGFSITNLADHGVALLANVERVTFADATLALDVGNGHGGQAYRIYQAAFNRAPDAAGLGYWINALDDGMAFTDVADGFVHSAEFLQLYGAHPGPADLVTGIYRNVLHRDPDAGGLGFWLDAMQKGVSPTELLVSFSESTENQAALAHIIGQGFVYTPYHG